MRGILMLGATKMRTKDYLSVETIIIHSACMQSGTSLELSQEKSNFLTTGKNIEITAAGIKCCSRKNRDIIFKRISNVFTLQQIDRNYCPSKSSTYKKF